MMGKDHYPGAARIRRTVRLLALLAAGAVVLIAIPSAGIDSDRPDAPRSRPASFSIVDTEVPDQTVLLEQLDEAIELRRREDFDRMLDARDPGELIEHATLTEVDFDHRTLGIDTLFIVGDELFGYPFRPENGWGDGGRSRRSDDGTPQLHRIHRGRSGGPDAFACFSCHFKGGPDGAGAQSQNAFLDGNGTTIVGADERNPPHLLGLGPVELLAREMSADLRRSADTARDAARERQAVVTVSLVSKGVSFGKLTARANGTFDHSEIEGVDEDLVVKPFGWKGHQSTIRDMSEESLHIHQGLLSKRVQLGIRDGTIAPDAYGRGHWSDVDNDGVSLEIDDGMLATLAGYLAQLEAPIVRPPRDEGLLDAFAAGRSHFEAIGCATCHVPTLELDDPRLAAWVPSDPDRPPYVIDVAKDGESPKIEPKYARYDTSYLVHLFSDLKRHDMGAALATENPQGTIPANVFLTRSLWGLAETAPYLHDGRAPTVHDAIVLHGGEAEAARSAYLALDEARQGELRVFLTSLSRKPKLFVP